METVELCAKFLAARGQLPLLLLLLLYAPCSTRTNFLSSGDKVAPSRSVSLSFHSFIRVDLGFFFFFFRSSLDEQRQPETKIARFENVAERYHSNLVRCLPFVEVRVVCEHM